MNTAVLLKKFNGDDYDIIPCDTLSRAISIIQDDPNCVITITDTDSTGEIEINFPGSFPDVSAYIP